HDLDLRVGSHDPVHLVEEEPPAVLLPAGPPVGDVLDVVPAPSLLDGGGLDRPREHVEVVDDVGVRLQVDALEPLRLPLPAGYVQLPRRVDLPVRRCLRDSRLRYQTCPLPWS